MCGRPTGLPCIRLYGRPYRIYPRTGTQTATMGNGLTTLGPRLASRLTLVSVMGGLTASVSLDSTKILGRLVTLAKQKFVLEKVGTASRFEPAPILIPTLPLGHGHGSKPYLYSLDST